MSTTTKIALVTGANKGIGKEIARQLGQLGMTVLIGARDEGRGRAAAQELAADGIDARPVQLEVTDTESIDAAAKLIERDQGRLDILVNNAGIVSTRFADLMSGADRNDSPEAFERTFATNVTGAMATTRAMLPLLRKASDARVVNVSSELGSLALLSDPGSEQAAVPLFAYNASKAALNAVTVMVANELRADGIGVNAISPGYCATDMNDNQGMLTAAQGASVAVRLATGPSGQTGEFHGQDGPLPW